MKLIGKVLAAAFGIGKKKRQKKAAYKRAVRNGRLVGLAVSFCAGAVCMFVVMHKLAAKKCSKDGEACENSEKKCPVCPVKKLLKKA